jgi:hypothetical protein
MSEERHTLKDLVREEMLSLFKEPQGELRETVTHLIQEQLLGRELIERLSKILVDINERHQPPVAQLKTLMEQHA